MIVIIGGNSEIGQATAKILTDKNQKVAFISRQVLDLEHAHTVTTYDQESITAILTNLSQQHEITGILHCPGSILLKPLHLLSEQDFQATLDINFFSAVATTQAVVKVLKQNISVVLFSTAACHIGLPNHEAISAAKGAVEGLMKSAAATYANKNIRFNCVAPGLVDTKLASNVTKSQQGLALSKKLHGLGRIGTPGDVAKVCAMLLDPHQEWISGQVFTVDGGLSNLKTYS